MLHGLRSSLFIQGTTSHDNQEGEDEVEESEEETSIGLEESGLDDEI